MLRSAVARTTAAVATLVGLSAAPASSAAAPGGAAAAARAAPAGAFTPPWFYHGIDGPKYTLVAEKEGYEIRRVEPTAWAVTTVKGFNVRSAMFTGFRRLFKYITGDNREGAKIAMTCPVLTLIQPSAGPFCESTFQVSFMQPWAVQEAGDAPTPNDGDTVVKTTGAATFYVASRGGWAMDDKSATDMAQGLVAALERDGVAVSGDAHFLAGYDPPFRLIRRHNELWIPATAADMAAFWGEGAGARVTAE